MEGDTYFVAVKIFLERDGKLLILKDDFGDWDLPGGRIKVDEFEAPLEQIIKREISEELGDNISYIIKEPIVFMRHERKEFDLNGQIIRIFAIGYLAIFNGGEIHLSPEHVEMKWVDIKSFVPEEYFVGGWLKGVKEYLVFRNKK